MNKTNSILKENHYSVVFARDMADLLTNINQEITSSYLNNKNPDSSAITNAFDLFDKSLGLEQNNITEIGEDKLVTEININYVEYRNSAAKLFKSQDPSNEILPLHIKFTNLYRKLTLLSQMNEIAIEKKTTDAKEYSKKATLLMTGIGSFGFLIAYAYTFIFSSFFSERFHRLYREIKEMESTGYTQKLHPDGDDELSEIAKAFNKMAESLSRKK
jgi:methyl-accepting chemotaxis protein